MQKNVPTGWDCRRYAKGQRPPMPLIQGEPRPCPQTQTWPQTSTQARRNLVDEISDVVHDIQEGLIHCAQQVAVIVAQRVDAPTCCDDDPHVAESILHRLRAVS